LARQSTLGVLSISLALLGLLMFWLVPLNLILSGAGILTGLLGVGTHYSTGGRPFRQAGTGLILSFITLLISLSLPLVLRGDLATRANYTGERQTPPAPSQ